MSWLKGIFGASESRPSDSSPGLTRDIGGGRGGIEPFNYVQAGLEAWTAEDHERAEQLLRQGVNAYRTGEPDGVDFALGRLGAFLLAQERIDEAAEVLDEAISLKTDIPAIWSDYLDIMALRRDVDGLFDVAMRSHDNVGGTQPPWDGLLARARRADRAGDSGFAEAVADRVAERAAAVGDQHASWTAIGVLGHVLERAGRLDDALDLWTAAFAEGSDDPTTTNRLSMHRERAREYQDAINIIEAALSRGLPANTEEQLRKRLERCRARAEGRKRRDVPAYSVRIGGDAFESVFQARVTPAIRMLQVQGSVARCFGVSKGVGTVVDVSLADGSEVGRHAGLPAFGTLQFLPSGFGLGTVRTGRIGDGVTGLTFLAPDLTEVAHGEVPDAVSDIAYASDRWYVGCRDGRLYAFRDTGELIWQWETPGAHTHEGDAYSRPCPYYVSSDGGQVVVASMGDLYCIGSDGGTRWDFELPDDEFETGEFSITIVGMGPLVSHLITTDDSVFVGSSDGRLLILSPTGQLRTIHEFGDYSVQPLVDVEGNLVAACSGNTLFHLERNGFRSLAEIEHAPEGVGVCGDQLYLWYRNRLDMLGPTGQVVWSAEFSKNISSAVADQDRLVCATGVLNAFSRAGAAADS